MHWDAVAAIAAVLQTALVAGAAAVALVQIRHFSHQNELAAFVQLYAIYNAPEARRARQFVSEELDGRLRDPQYLREIVEGRMHADIHPESLVLNYFNQVGQLVVEGVVKPELLVREHAAIAPMMWKHLLPVIALRRTTFPLFVGAFEAFVIHCEALDTSVRFAQLRALTPSRLRWKWDARQHEVEAMKVQMLQRLQPTNAAAPE